MIGMAIAQIQSPLGIAQGYAAWDCSNGVIKYGERQSIVLDPNLLLSEEDLDAFEVLE
jgi:hypothetical protein